MANYRAVANGNWNTGSTWDGGNVPPNGQGHNIYSNGFTVTIDQNVDVALITNAAITASFVGGGTSAAAAGGFTVSQNGITISASSITNGANSSATVHTLNFTGTNFATFTLIGNILGMSIGNGNPLNCFAVVNSSNGTLNIYGNITGGNSNGANSVGLFASSGTTNIFNSNINGGGGGTATFEAIRNSGGSVNISNSLLTPSTTNVSVNNSSGTITATNCVFNAVFAQPCYSGSGTNRLSGTFISASNGRQPISSAIWILNTTPTASYIQHALDGINSGSFVRFYTADNSLGQANPTDVRSGVSYASGSLTGRLTVPARESVSLNVNYGPSMPFTATRSGTTATATLAYSYPLVAGDQITVTGASNSEWNSTYTIASVVSGTSVTFTVPNTHSATAGTGATMQTKGTGVLTLNDVVGAVNTAIDAAVTASINPNVTTSINAAIPTAVNTAMDTQWNKQTTALTVTGSIGARLANASTVATTGQQITAALG